MQRIDIINKIGSDYLAGNLEQSGEFSYVQAGIKLSDIPKNAKGQQNFKLDIRFEKDNMSILVETINVRPSKKDVEFHKDKLLNSYCALETQYKPNNNIILILAYSGNNNKIFVWKKKPNETPEALTDTKIKTVEEYEKLFQNVSVNNEIKIKRSVLELNEILHKNSISADIRGQFVGTCLLALKSKNFVYKNLETGQIIAGIKGVIENLLTNDINKATKLVLLNDKVLKDQKVRNLKSEKFQIILSFIEEKIVPNINYNTSIGQDLLNLFFTTFNKYVGKKDKNQAFTPDHITHFMCKVADINRNTKVLDPTCGSGSFIVQALIQELNECETDDEKRIVKKNNIYGIEVEEKAFGLSTTNMLIHGDGNSNVVMDEKNGCFGFRKWIQDSGIDVVLMNPPYNAKPNEIPETIKDNNKIIYHVHNWDKKQRDGKEDPTKGFCFVNYIADCVGKDNNNNPRTAKLLCLLPLACAIGSKTIIQQEKEKILENNTLDAVFTLPSEMFYPGASANACCMVFTLGTSHFTTTVDENGVEKKVPRKTTFFGYFKDDGFIKKKNLGRISKEDGNGYQIWKNIEQKWLDLYHGNFTDVSLGIRKKVTSTDEWLAEAYIQTDYSNISIDAFKQTLQKYFSYLVGNGYDLYSRIKVLCKTNDKPTNIKLDTSDWKEFTVSDLFKVELSKGDLKEDECPNGCVPLVSSGSLNNGIVKYIDEEGDGKAQLFKKNQLTVDMFGQAYYQPANFYSVSHGRVNILSPKNANIFNSYIGLFICSVINIEQYRFSYNRAVYKTVIENLLIKLPAKQKVNEHNKPEVDKNGTPIYEPNWQYMEDFIKSLPYADLI